MTTSSATIGLAVAFAVVAVPYVTRAASFIWLYFLRPSSIKKYLHGSAPYALVTGATDGIGKGTATELLRNGFNLVLHGRNETKMQKVVEELRARVPERQGADIRFFLADASVASQDFAQLLEPFKDLHITLVYHNVGGSDVRPERLDERSEDYINGIINKNALFSLFLARAMLPQLRRAATTGPVHVYFTGSIASDISPVRMGVYAASKGFLASLVGGLDNDELYFDGPTGVRYTYLSVGSVHSDNHETPMQPGLGTPTSDAMGKHIIARVGCGRRRVSPYWFHALLHSMLKLVDERILDYFGAEEMQRLIAQAQKGKS